MSTLPATKKAFVEELVGIIQAKYPSLSVARPSTSSLVVAGMHVDVESLYRCHASEGRSWRRSLCGFLDELHASVVGDTSRPWKDVCGSILPRIMPTHMVGSADVEHVDFVAGTVIAFAIDSPRSITTVGRNRLNQWAITRENLHSVALANLASITPPSVFAKHQTIGVSLTTSDCFESARLLLPDLHQRLRGTLGREFIVVIPSRDSFHAFPLLNRAELSRLAAMNREVFERAPYPITPSLFLVTADGVSSADHMLEGEAP